MPRRPRRAAAPPAVARRRAAAALAIAAAAWLWRPGRRAAADAADAWDAAGAVRGLGASGPVATTAPLVLRWRARVATLDLNGLWTEALARAARGGAGSLYDALKVLPPGSRPAVAVLPGRSGRALAAAWLRGGVASASAGDARLLFFRPWPATPPPRVPGWSRVDELDCGEPGSEARHGYAVRSRGRGAVPVSLTRALPDPAVGSAEADGGWLVDGEERFIVLARPGAPLIVLARLAAARPAVLEARLGDGPPETVALAGDPGRFQTVLVLQAAAERVRGADAVVIRAAAGGYADFHLWALQPSRDDEVSGR